ncbi:hypothetical protein [Kaistia nematophila]|uniref:HD domain-containing protein n=1 Tax=Kaistia nematophila TaxID=2994654 RepID=A0A9X3E3C1_9HYPH|nr:hypothetical protein [Kaistia nematophila]MCX5570597.1 hypothetical protein [Kaistia nematophila]
MQTRSGLAVDLARPDLSAIDMMVDVAIPLSLTNRFAGHTAKLDCGGFSTAQHAYLGADAVLQETGGDTDAALAFLLHDAHEAFIGDPTSPFVASLDRMAIDRLGRPVNGVIQSTLKIMKAGLDAEIYRRLGLDWPLSAYLHGIVADMDLRMLRRERDELIGDPPGPWANNVETAAPIRSLEGWDFFRGGSRMDVAREWMSRLRAWHPRHVEVQSRGGEPWLLPS